MRKLNFVMLLAIFAIGTQSGCTHEALVTSPSLNETLESDRVSAKAVSDTPRPLVETIAPAEAGISGSSEIGGSSEVAAPISVMPLPIVEQAKGVTPARSIAPDRVVDLWTRLISKDSSVIVGALVDLAGEDPARLRELRYSSKSDRGWIDQHPPTLMMHEGRGIEWQQDVDGRWIRLFKSDPRWKSLPQATKVRAMIALDHFTTGVLLSAQTARSRVMLEECFTGRIAAIGELYNNREGSPEAQAYDFRPLSRSLKNFGSKYNYFMDPELRPEPSEIPLSP